MLIDAKQTQAPPAGPNHPRQHPCHDAARPNQRAKLSSRLNSIATTPAKRMASCACAQSHGQTILTKRKGPERGANPQAAGLPGRLWAATERPPYPIALLSPSSRAVRLASISCQIARKKRRHRGGYVEAFRGQPGGKVATNTRLGLWEQAPTTFSSLALLAPDQRARAGPSAF